MYSRKGNSQSVKLCCFHQNKHRARISRCSFEIRTSASRIIATEPQPPRAGARAKKEGNCAVEENRDALKESPKPSVQRCEKPIPTAVRGVEKLRACQLLTAATIKLIVETSRLSAKRGVSGRRGPSFRLFCCFCRLDRI